MTEQMLKDLMLALGPWIYDDTQTEYIIRLKGKTIRLTKKVTND